ncbi:hypothetical protein [Aquabacterium sp.]|uniref:hypothetical protein n=1 Tax=Aquabacterium sp. TaxID=1872578 RepID=UPI00378483C4
MSDLGYRSVLDGSCLPSVEDAAAGACAGYPRSVVVDGDRQTLSCQIWSPDEFTASADYFQISDSLGVVDHYAVSISPSVCLLQQSPWALSVEDGAEVAWLVLGVWFLGWCARVVRITLA